MFQSGQVVRVNLAGLQAEGVMFQAAVTGAVGTTTEVPSEASILLPWRYGSRSSRRPYPRRQVTVLLAMTGAERASAFRTFLVVA
jgi:hypothetical protein